MKVIKIASSPKVGIFWLYKNGIISFMEDARTSPAVGEWKDSPYDHFEKWSAVISLYPELKNKEYYDIPRGRVIYNVNRHIFRVLTSGAIASNKADLVKIGREFSLPPSATEVVTDFHYEINPDLSEDD